MPSQATAQAHPAPGIVAAAPWRVQALTVRDVREAMQRMLQPDRMVTVVVGGKQ